ncbi:MAG: hypothetical protein K2R98_31050 [Gemmataceae bacterium]|nr:hypothetical protein [Gemmataceae bacterium]
MTGPEAALAVIDALEQLGVPYMVVGSFSSNVYGVARSTHDADFVIDLSGGSVQAIADRLGSSFRLDPQMSFETVTMTRRFNLAVVGSEFQIELFLLSDDPHDRQRFLRRQRRPLHGRAAFLPSAEDVIVTKLHWAVRARRGKDREDVRDMIAVQGNTLDWTYIYHWADQHGTRSLLDEIRQSLPPL